MNVLVYNGPEVVHSSLNAVLSSLRTLLLSHYVVQPVEHHVLAKQPWSLSCALLVFPRLSQPFFSICAHNQVRDYVDRGGALLAFGAGASCSTRGIVAGLDQLSLGADTPKMNSSFSFFDKIINTDIYPTFGAQSSKPSLVKLKTLDGDIVRVVYEASRTDFTGFEGERGIRVLGRYIGGDDGQEGKIAGLGCDIGGGRIALWSPDLDQNLTEEPASTLVSSSTKDGTMELDKERRKLLRRTILYLGLQLPATSDSDDELRPIARPFPQFLVSSPDRPEIVPRIIDALSSAFRPDNEEDSNRPKILKDANDTFHFHESASANALLLEYKALFATKSDPSTWQPKHVVIHRDGTLPSKIYTASYFDLDLFFQYLAYHRPPSSSSSSVSRSRKSEKWPLGSALFFSPAVTSTQTLLDKNPTFLSSLPTPIVSLASHQLSARGRGSNVWLSPSGSLSYSIHLRLTTDDGVPWSKLVFVQYLFALAVCEAVRDHSVLGRGGNEQEGAEGEGWRVRIKWPNDIYALVGPRGQEEKKKIAGILVNTNFGAKGVDIVIGCGLNVFNERPMTSLVHLPRNTPSGNKRRANLSIERTAALILTKFEEMWTEFVAAKGSFEPFLDAYLKRWMHSDQLVTLTTVTPPIQVRITGITLDYGLLRTVPERRTLSSPYFSYGGGGEEEYINLQPDGNSFDLMSGMIKAKH